VHDKKLTKNTVKRCVIDPFCEKFMKSTDDTSSLGTELAKYKDVPQVYEMLAQTFVDLDTHSLLSETLKSDLRPYLRDFLQLIGLSKFKINEDLKSGL
jgi:hypothetical protein